MSDLADGDQARDRWSVPEWFVRLGRASWLAVGIVVAAGMAIVGLAAMRELFVPVVLASFLAVGFIPLVDWFEERRVPRSIGAVLVILLIVGIFAAAMALVVLGITDQADELKAQYDKAVLELQELVDRFDPDGEYVDRLKKSFDSSGSTLRDGVTSGIGTVLGSVAALVTGLILGALVLYYALKDGHRFTAWASQRPRAESADQVARMLQNASTTIRIYYRSRTILSLAVAVAIGIAMALLSVPLPASIAVVNFIGGYIPYFGAFLGGAFAVLLALSDGGVAQAVWALIIILCAQLALENLLEPKLLGDSLNLHPITVLLATMFGGMVAGIVGLILAAPLTAIVVDGFRELKGAGFFEPEAEPVAGRPSNDANR